MTVTSNNASATHIGQAFHHYYLCSNYRIRRHTDTHSRTHRDVRKVLRARTHAHVRAHAGIESAARALSLPALSENGQLIGGYLR